MAIIFAAALFGTTVGIAITNPTVWFFSFFGCAGLYVLIHHSARKMVLSSAFAFALGLHGSAYIGFWGMYPFDWIGGTTPLLSIAAIAAYWIPMIIVPSSVFAAAALLFIRLRTGAWVDTLLFASSSLLGLYGSLWVESVFLWGPNSLLGPHLSSALPGYALAHFPPLLTFAPLAGAYGLTFATFLIGGVFAHTMPLFHTNAQRLLYVLTLACLCISSVAFNETEKGLPHPTQSSVSVGIVTTYGDTRTEEGKERLAALVHRFEATHDPVDLLVFPEEVGLPPNLQQKIRARAVLDSYVGGSGDRITRQMVLKNNEGNVLGVYDKRFLTPGGEYEPVMLSFVTRLLTRTIPETEQAFRAHRRTKGERPPILRFESTVLGAMFCSEVLSPSLYAAAARDGAEVFVNASSHAWFHSSRAIEASVVAAARTRAAESRRSLVLAGNATPSFIVSPEGRIVARAPRGESSVMYAHIPTSTVGTPFARFGDWTIAPLVLLGSASSVIWCFWRRRAGCV